MLAVTRHGFAFYVAAPVSSIETHSPLTFIRSYARRVKLWVVNVEGEIAGDHAVMADPPAVLFEADGVVPIVVVVAQAVPLETFGLQLGTDQCAI